MMDIKWLSAGELVRLTSLSKPEPSGPVLTSSGPIMVMPYTQIEEAKRALALAAQRAGADIKGLLIGAEDSLGLGFIKVVNLIFKHTQSPWFGYMAQDAFAGRLWMESALKALSFSSTSRTSNYKYPPEEATPEQASRVGMGKFLGFNDGKWHGALAGFGLASRSWAEKNYGGDFFQPSYKSHYADTELTLLALQEGVYVYEPSSLLVEVDWGKESSKVNPEDRALFKERSLSGFDARVSEPRLLEMFS
jgi:hypothetical protein